MRWVGTKSLQGVDVNLDVLRLQSTVVHLDAMLRRSHARVELETEREFVFSCDVIASCNGAAFEFSSTGWYKVRETPIKRCLTWGRTKYGSTTVLQPP